MANDGEKEYWRADLANILTLRLLSRCSPYLLPVYLVVGKLARYRLSLVGSGEMAWFRSPSQVEREPAD